VAVIAMVLAHVIDSWTREADRHVEPFYTLFFIGGVASPLFLFLAGLATAMSAASKARREGGPAAGAALARRRGWEIFGLALLFRLQSQLLGMGPLTNVLKVDMLNTMGLSIVAASYVWQLAPSHRARIALLALVTGAITMVTPLVRATPLLTPLPDAIEAYLRPAATYSAFPLFPWAGFLFAGVIVGVLVDAVRTSPRRQMILQIGTAVTAVGGVWLAWRASFLPSIYEQAEFWHDSPTFFFIRLGLVAVLVPVAWSIEQIVPPPVLRPIALFGRSSLFVYWIHVEMVYGVIAEPIKRELPLWGSLAGTALLTLLLYLLVLLKNRLRERYELRGALRLLAPVIR
jgi:acyltransferase